MIMFKALSVACILIGLALPTLAQASEEADLYRNAVSSMKKGDWRAALATAKRSGPVARDIIEWNRLRAGLGDFADTKDFLARNGDWPGLRLLRRKAETSLTVRSDPDTVLAFFADEPPQTGTGARILIAAYEAKGLETEALAEAVHTWQTMIITDFDEKALLRKYGNVLKQYHEARLDMLLWRDAPISAERMYPRVSKGWQAMARARIQLRKNEKNVDGLIAKVPAALRNHPGLNYERMQWRARRGKSQEAMDLMLEAGADKLGRPEIWAGWRRSFARTEMRSRNTDLAYRLASQHGLTSGSHFADLEWLSGYLALTYQNDGEKALGHFLRFRGAVETPISLGRAGYWEGRAHELIGDTESANLAYAFGAEYQTSFYGILAAERAGLPLDPALAGDTQYPPWSTTSLPTSSVFQAAQLFLAAGDINQAETFLRHMTETLPRNEIGALGDYVLDANQHHLAVMIGKQAARRGITLPKAYYPIAPLGLVDYPVPRELSLAIARRESEFDPVVRSGVGARGLMQVMPATAKAVAKGLQIPYSLNRLTADPAYNARLGTAYLDQLMATFGGNIIMVAAGYNAGPGRPIRWMKRFGDPRKGEINIVDWIEHIPFNETRNYVMRVAESLPVYRARLTGETGPINFSQELISRPGHERSAQKGEFLRPKARPVLTD
ncbi:lytic transglycosylase domain-containing protein [Rhodobacteraceae bacterium]|nr:lytic transglycosylase domain-containing protein [Paracoccaceae bacterium]